MLIVKLRKHLHFSIYFLAQIHNYRSIPIFLICYGSLFIKYIHQDKATISQTVVIIKNFLMVT